MKVLNLFLVSYFTLLLLSCEKDYVPPTGSKIVFDGGFETNDVSQWDDVNRNLSYDENYQIEIVTNPVREGIYAVKTTVHDGDEFLDTGGERCDFERRKFQEREGDDFWYAWSTQFPSDFADFTYTVPEDWFVIADWHSDYSKAGQLIQLEIDAESNIWVKGLTGKISGYDNFQGNGNAYYFEKKVTDNLSLGKWHDFVFHVKWTTENKGIIEFWHKIEDENTYTKILDLVDIPTLQYKQIKSNYKPPYFLLAHYRDASFTHTTTLYHDGYRMGTTKESIVGDNGLYDID